MSTAASLATNGVNFKLDPENQQHVRGIRNVLFISGLIMAMGIVLTSTSQFCKIPEPLRKTVLFPLDEIATTIFTMSVIAYLFIAMTKKKEKPPMHNKGTQFPLQEVPGCATQCSPDEIERALQAESGNDSRSR